MNLATSTVTLRLSPSAGQVRNGWSIGFSVTGWSEQGWGLEKATWGMLASLAGNSVTYISTPSNVTAAVELQTIPATDVAGSSAKGAPTTGRRNSGRNSGLKMIVRAAYL